MITYVDIIGFIGSFTGSSMTIPQIIKTYKQKSAKDISYGMLLTLLIGNCILMAYGILLPSLPIVSSLALSIFTNMILIGLKVRYDGCEMPSSLKNIKIEDDT